MKSNKKYTITLYILSFIVPVFTVLIGLLAGGYAPFGGKNILGAGEVSHFLPYFYEMYDRAKEGHLLGYSHTFELGYDFTSLLSYNLSDPTNLLILLFPRTSIIAVLNILYMLKTGLAGLSGAIFFSYLDKYNEFTIDRKKESDTSETSDKKNKANFVIGIQGEPKSGLLKFIKDFNWKALGLSMAYALSLTMISVGFNVTYMTSIAILPLIIMGVDKIVRGNKPYTFIIFFAISLICNLHISIITLIFVLLYFFTRDFKSVKDFFNCAIKMMISIILSITASSFMLFSAISSDGFKNDFSIKFPEWSMTNPFDTFRQLVSHTPLATLTMYGKIDISVSVLLVLLIFIYIFTKNLKISTRIKNTVLLVFIMAGTCTTTAQHLMNGFSTGCNGKIHFGYIIVFMMLIMAYEALTHMADIKPYRIIIAALLTLGVVVSPIFLSNHYDSINPFVQAMEFLFGYFLISLIYSSKSMTRSLYFLLISILVMVELIPVFTGNINKVGHSVVSQKLINISSYNYYEASRYIHSKDKNAIVHVLNNGATNDTPLTESMMGYDYIICKENETDFDAISDFSELFKDKDGIIGINIYKNPYNLKNTLLPASIKDYSFNESKPFESTDTFVNDYLGCEPLFENINVEINPVFSSESSVNFEASVADKGDVYCKAYFVSYIKSKGKEENDGKYYFNQSIPGMEYAGASFSYQSVLFDKDQFVKLYNKLKETEVASSLPLNEETKVNTSSSGYLLSGYPELDSLEMYVNGKKTDTITVLGDNALIPVNDPGENTILIKYKNKPLIPGILISLLGIGIIVFIYLNSEKKLKKKYEKTVNNISRWTTENYVYVMSLIICTIVFILSQFISSCYPFGTKSTASGDGLIQYFSFWTAHAKSVMNGNYFPTVTYNIGSFFDSYMDYFIGKLLYPWNLVKYRLLPENMYLITFTLEYYLYFIMSAVSIIYYLTHRSIRPFKKSDKRLIIISMLYCLSSFSAVFFSYSGGFRYMPYLPLIILGMEQTVYKKKSLLYICMLTQLMITSPYQAFLLCEFLVLYFFTMNFKDIKDFICKGLLFARNSIISAGLSAVALAPFYLATTGSAYSESDTAKASITKSFVSFSKLISDYYTGHNMRAVTSDNSQTASYCGLIMLFIIPLYLINKKISTMAKIRYTIITLLLFVATNNELLNYVFHGFHFQSLAPNRFAAFIIFLLICILSDILIEYKEYKTKYIGIVVFCVTAFMCFIYYLNNKSFTITLAITITLFCIYLIASIIYTVKKKSGLLNILLYIAAADIVMNALIVFPNSLGSPSDILSMGRDIDALVSKVNDTNDFDKITEFITSSTDYKNIGLITDINTLSYFTANYTTDTKYHLEFYNISCGLNSSTYNSGNPLADMMLHIKYHITYDDDSASETIYNPINTYKKLKLNENPYYLPLGFVISNTETKDLDYETHKKYSNAFEYQNDISRKLNGTDIYSVLDTNEYKNSTDNDNEVSDKKNNDKTYYKKGDVYSYEEANSIVKDYLPLVFHFKEDIKGHIFIDIHDQIYYLGTADKNSHDFSIEYPLEGDDAEKYKPAIAVFNDDALMVLHNKLSNNTLENITEDGRNIYATLNSDTSGTLYISLPYYSGWNAYIDGKKVDIKRYMGSMGIDITQGEHTLKLTYKSPGSMQGIIITVITLLIIILHIIVNKVYRKNTIYRKNTSINTSNEGTNN